MTPRDLQMFGFSYWQVRATGKTPSRKIFLSIAIERGWTFQEFDAWASGKEWTT